MQVEELSRSLSPRWQSMVYFAGYLVGVLALAFKDVEELVEETKPRPDESPQAKAFGRAYDRALNATDPADRMTAAESALAALETLEPWPFADTLPAARVTRGTLLGVLGAAYWRLRSHDPAAYAELAVSKNEEAKQYLREEDGEYWTTLMMNASAAYADRLAGDPGENLEQAIRYGETALMRLDRSRDPDSWSQAKSNLAGFFAQRKKGEPAANLERAITEQQEALDAISRKSKPLDWAISRGSLGSFYLRRILGDRQANLELAKTCLEEALEHIPRSRASFEWALTAVHLASVYDDSALIQHPSNAARALELLTEAIEVYAGLGDWEHWAGAYVNLGTYWASKPTDDRLAAVGKAIECFEKALTVFTVDRFPQDHAMVSNNLASALQDRREMTRPQEAAAGIAEARRSVDRFVRDSSPRDWARAVTTLGHALLASRDGDLIEEALACFRDALTVVTPKSAPEEWALATGNLANAYASRRRGDLAENLEEAIRLQEAALDALNPLSYPDSWVSAMQNLAVSYQERIVGSRADNIEKVLAVLETAMVLRTSFDHPERRSELLELLGTAFLDRLRGDPNENLERAIDSYRSAQELRNRDTSPAAWLRLHHKMLRAQLRLQDGGSQKSAAADGNASAEPKRPSSDEFIAEMQAELAAISPADDLPTWVNGQVALGDMYGRSAPDSVDGLEHFRQVAQDNQRKAIEVYRGALAAIDKTDEPVLWAWVNERIGHAYEVLHLWAEMRRRAMPFDDHDPEDLARDDREARQALDAAVGALTEALTTFRADPRKALTGDVRLGRLHVEREDWEAARQAFASAARAADVLLADVEVNEEELKDTLKALSEWAELAPYVFVINGEVEQALEAAEIAKARLAAKALTLEALDLPAEDRRHLKSLQEEIEQHEAKLVWPYLVHRTPPLNAVMRCRKELREFVAGVSATSARELIAEMVADGSVLVFPFLRVFPLVTDPVGCLEIAFQRAGVTRTESLVLDKSLGGKEFWQTLGDPRKDWATKYAQHQEGKSSSVASRATLGAVAKALGSRFAGPLLQLFERCGIPPGSRLHVLPQGALGALPLALARCPDGTALLDHFELSLSPSLRVLAAAKARRDVDGGDRSLALCVCGKGGGERKALEFVGFETETVTSWFDAGAVDLLIDSEATKANCLRALERRTIWHFAAHGVFEALKPVSSGIELVGGERLTVEDLLEARGLAKPSLVVLSACETGLYDQKELPNEFIGLPAALMQVGASGVVATLWSVWDVVSTLVMSRFHELYAEGTMAPGAALRGAQLWLRDSTANEMHRALDRWVGESRLSAHEAARMRAIIDRQDRGEGQSGPPFSAPPYWGGFVYYGA
ncbi:MAG TPA: CHAT domain-containing protein [Thermoanaerobaculia bacterium]|nr:CHAT domain-containing protein [Thermoanaerobaculia bacterium]